MNELVLARAVVMVVTVLFIEPVATELSNNGLKPTRPRAFDLAADAETVVGVINKNFSCDGREYGYYADQNQNCQVFHICMPVQTALGRTLDTFQFSFFCPSRTRFSQDSRTCIDEEHAYPCHKAHNLYDLNKHIGQRPSKKNRPVKHKASAGGTHKLTSPTRVKPSGDTNSSLSSAEFSDSGNFQSLSPSRSSSSGLSPLKSHQSSGTSSLLKNEGTPVNVDAGLDAGASGRTRGGGGGGQSSSFSSGSTSLPDHRVTGSVSAGINRKGPNPSKHTVNSASINHFTAPGFSSPPRSQVSPTVSINRKLSKPSSVQKDDHSSANFATASYSSSRRGSSGISGSRSPAGPGLPSSATTNDINRKGSDNHQINTRTLDSSGPSRVVVNKRPISSKAQNGIKSAKKSGQESFPGSSVNSLQSSPSGSKLFTPAGAHPSHSSAHGGGFEFLKLEKEMVQIQDPLSPASDTLGVAPVTGTENTSLGDDRSQGSFLSSKGRKMSSTSGSTDSDSSHLTPRSSNRPSTGSRNRGSATVSSGASRRASTSGLTPKTRQPVYPTPQPVTSSSSHQQSVLTAPRVSPSRQPVLPTRQPVFPLRQVAPPPTQETLSPPEVHQFSLDTSQEEGEVHPTSTENYEEEDDYGALVTTEAASEAERDLNEAQISRSRSSRIGSSTIRCSPSTRNSIVAPGRSCGSSGSSVPHNDVGSSENLGSLASTSLHEATNTLKVRGPSGANIPSKYPATSTTRRSSTVSTTATTSTSTSTTTTAAAVTRTVTRNRGKKKFQPSPYLLQLFKWGLQSSKNTNKFTPGEKRGSSGSRGKSGDPEN
ncbi:uncharacterized protein [Panulirus ornatus]|uniref:uncharacterized protein n=1 Tax=Panulirus ornatus TaxID=150431 RepID=UPI003A8819BF